MSRIYADNIAHDTVAFDAKQQALARLRTCEPIWKASAEIPGQSLHNHASLLHRAAVHTRPAIHKRPTHTRLLHNTGLSGREDHIVTFK